MASINPPYIDKEDDPQADVAPRDRWSIDLLTDDGRQKIMEAFNAIRAECKAEDEGQ